MDDMRKAFEAWAEGRYPLRTAGDSYACGETHDAWQAWQAATMAERERCAKVCDDLASYWQHPGCEGQKEAAEQAAYEIRGE